MSLERSKWQRPWKLEQDEPMCRALQHVVVIINEKTINLSVTEWVRTQIFNESLILLRTNAGGVPITCKNAEGGACFSGWVMNGVSMQVTCLVAGITIGNDSYYRIRVDALWHLLKRCTCITTRWTCVVLASWWVTATKATI